MSRSNIKSSAESENTSICSKAGSLRSCFTLLGFSGFCFVLLLFGFFSLVVFWGKAEIKLVYNT